MKRKRRDYALSLLRRLSNNDAEYDALSKITCDQASFLFRGGKVHLIAGFVKNEFMFYRRNTWLSRSVQHAANVWKRAQAKYEVIAFNCKWKYVKSAVIVSVPQTRRTGTCHFTLLLCRGRKRNKRRHVRSTLLFVSWRQFVAVVFFSGSSMFPWFSFITSLFITHFFAVVLPQ